MPFHLRSLFAFVFIVACAGAAANSTPAEEQFVTELQRFVPHVLMYCNTPGMNLAIAHD